LQVLDAETKAGGSGDQFGWTKGDGPFNDALDD